MILIATDRGVLLCDPTDGAMRGVEGISARRPSCLAVAPDAGGSAWCGTEDAGVFRSDDGGASWTPSGLAGEKVTALAASAAQPGHLWAGTDPSQVWRSGDGGVSWNRSPGLRELPSSHRWSFPPRPDTDHVRWIACHPVEAGRLWVAIEAGALVATTDGGDTWRDAVPGGPYDTHELAVQTDRPDRLCVAAGDGYFESLDSGVTWVKKMEGMEARYCRSVVLDPTDPTVVMVSTATTARRAYVPGRADGRLYRREGNEAWHVVTDGWPDPPDTVAPLLGADAREGWLLAADERGLHRSDDHGASWKRFAEYPQPVEWLRAIATFRH